MWRDPSLLGALALAICLVTGGASAQSGNRSASPSQERRIDRTSSLSGRVQAPDAGPIVQARIELSLAAEGADADPSRTAFTDTAGGWRIGGLGPGVWRIEVAAAGYRTALGKVDLRAGRGGPVEVTLEIDSDAVVRDWLEQANALLADDPAAAQSFYEKALTVVPLPQAPPVRRTLARAHFLQGRIDEAVRSLQRALLTNPKDAEARLLLPALLASAEREDEGRRWLELLDNEGVAAAGGAAFGVEVPKLELGARLTGRFRTTLEKPSSQGTGERLLAALGSWERLGVDGEAPWSPADESFEVYVPAPGVPGKGPQRTYGVLVWISPTPRGGLPDPEMTAVLDAQSLIWIGANRSGNARPRGDRMRLALDAAAGMRATYPIDPERVYVGGYSGGGRMASAMALHFTGTFTGGVYFMGVDFYRNIAKPDQPGTSWGAVLQPPSAQSKADIERRSRFVFITGGYDFNRAQTHAYRDEYVADGFERVSLIEIPEAGHYYGFRAAELGAAVAALDAARPEATDESMD